MNTVSVVEFSLNGELVMYTSGDGWSGSETRPGALLYALKVNAAIVRLSFSKQGIG